MTIVREGSLRLEFDPAKWTVLKWDEQAHYVEGIARLNGGLTDVGTGAVRLGQLKGRLAWLTPQVWVDDPLDPAVPLLGVQVSRAQ